MPELLGSDVPAVWRSLGLPGLADVHVHFLPERMLAKVWQYFDQAETHYGRAWPIQYRGSDAERIATLQALGVHRFPTLCYPHKPGMAGWLNQWCVDFADRASAGRGQRDVLRRAVGRRRCPLGAGARGADLQGARPGRRLRSVRSGAGRGLGPAGRGRRAGGHALRIRSAGRRAHRAGADQPGSATASVDCGW